LGFSLAAADTSSFHAIRRAQRGIGSCGRIVAFAALAVKRRAFLPLP
jgi:hypothetical protein